MVLLTLVHWRCTALEAAERGGGGSMGGGGAEQWGVCWAPSSWVEAIAPAVTGVVASGALVAAVDTAWRLHFLRHQHQHQWQQQRWGSQQPRRRAVRREQQQ